METSTIQASGVVDVVYAVLHNVVFVPNLGQFGPTLTTRNASNQSKVTGLSFNGSLLTISIGKDTIVVPVTTVSHMMLAR